MQKPLKVFFIAVFAWCVPSLVEARTHHIKTPLECHIQGNKMCIEVRDRQKHKLLWISEQSYKNNPQRYQFIKVSYRAPSGKILYKSSIN